jgi:hypothetical protein
VAEGSQGSVTSVEEDQEKDMDISDIPVDMIAAGDDSICNLDEVNGFLYQAFGKSVKLVVFFDVDTFVRSAVVSQKTVGLDHLNVKKHFRLRECVTVVTAAKGNGKRGKVTLWFLLFFLSLFYMDILRVGTLNMNGGRDRNQRAWVLEVTKFLLFWEKIWVIKWNFESLRQWWEVGKAQICVFC